MVRKIVLRKMAQSAAALGIALGIASTSLEPAQAGGGRVAAGVAAGLVAGTLLGAYAYGGPRYYEPACYPGPRQCDWVGRRCWYNNVGDYVCRGGEWRCWRPRVCD
jgi:hypothetical protein